MFERQKIGWTFVCKILLENRSWLHIFLSLCVYSTVQVLAFDIVMCNGIKDLQATREHGIS